SSSVLLRYTLLFAFFFFVYIPPPRIPTLFPYTTLFRSAADSKHWRNTVACVSGELLPPFRTFYLFFLPIIWMAVRRGLRGVTARSEEHTSELQSRSDLVCRLLLEKKK